MAFFPFLLVALTLPSTLLAQGRDSEPLVVTGEQVVFSQNNTNMHRNVEILFQVDLPVSPHLLVGFRREEGSWVQVPVQVSFSFLNWPQASSGRFHLLLEDIHGSWGT